MRALSPPLVLPLAVLALSCAATAQSPVVFTSVASGLSSPVDVQHAPGDATRLFILEQPGRIRVVENGALLATPALNITTRISSGGERGLLGLAFHPAWPDSAYIYVDYTRTGDGATVIARYTRTTASPVSFDPQSERILLTVPQPFSNHNAGAIAFGPDGYLYVTLGDGGSGGDPQNNGQRPETLLGSILRLDVDGGGNAPDCGGAAALYTIPPDNPFVGSTTNACDEAFAYGFRNPWRMSFDRETGTLWAADVGQGSWEEVDTVATGRNYGWKIMEGAHCYSPSTGCNQTGLELPVWEYARSGGRCAITGGYVYRGAAIPDLVGEYIYADYCSGQIWALDLSGATPTNVQIGTRTSPTSFGEDLAGELYVTSGSSVFRLDPNPVASEGGPMTTALSLALAGPHPVAQRTALAMAAAASGPARLTLLDVLGREVAVLFDGALRAGEPREAALDATGLAPGLYVARLTTPEGARSLRLVVAR